MRPHRHLYAATAILLLAGALRLAGLDRTGIEIDEAFSIQLASLSPAGIVRGTAVDQHPPFYYLLLHGWMQVAGTGVVATRLLSALAGWMTVALVYRLGRQITPAVGLLAALLMAVSPPHLWYSQQVRQYALLMLLVTVSTWLAWRWWSDPPARTGTLSVLYVTTTLAALYTHSFALLVIAAHVAAGLLASRMGPDRVHLRRALHWFALQALVVAGVAPWLPVIAAQAMNHALPWVPPLSWPVIRSSWLFLLQGREWTASVGDYASAFLGLGLLLLGLWRVRQRPRNVGWFAWIVFWFALPILLVVTVSLFTPIYQNKQLLIVVPALLLMLAAGCLRPAPRWARIVLAAALLGLMVHARYEQYVDPYKQPWDEVAAYLDTRAQPGDLLYMNAAASVLAVDYYLASDLNTAGYPPGYDLLQGGWAGEIATGEAVEEQLTPLSARHARVWLLEYFPGFWDPQGVIQTWLRAHYSGSERVEFGEVSLWLFTR